MSKEKTYTLRNLTADDMFPMFKIISGIGLKEFKAVFEEEDVKKVFASAKNGAAKKENPDFGAIGITVAMNLADVVFSNLPRCKDSIYQFLSGLSGMNAADIAAMPMADFMTMVVDVLKQEEFKDFFQAAARLFK